MMKYFLTLLFSSLTISVMAEMPQLSRNDLGQVTIICDLVSDVSSMSDSKSAQSLQQFMRERHLTLNDNRLRNLTHGTVALYTQRFVMLTGVHSLVAA